MEGPNVVDVTPSCIDHNDNHVGQEEMCFTGYGEDESSQPKKIYMSKKWKLKEDEITDFLSNDSNWEKFENGALIQQMMGKFFSDGDNQDIHCLEKNSTRDALRTILHSVNQDHHNLWEWLEQTTVTKELMGFSDAVDSVFNSMNTDESSRRESTASSSLGILSYSEMSSLSCVSLDGIKNEFPVRKEKADTTELIVEIEELHHQNKRLNEERSRLASQVTQTEDSNTQLVHENEELMKRMLSLQNLVDKLKETEKDHDDAQAALYKLEETNQELQNRLVREERENKELGEQLKDSNQMLLVGQSDLDSARQQLLELSDALKESEIVICTLKEQYESCIVDLKAKTALLEEKEIMLQNFMEVTESLKQQKHALELQLSQAEEEIACLQLAARRDITPEPTTNNELLTTTCSQSDNSTSLEPPCQSTPVVFRKASLCAEMRDAMITEGQVPFCGKHIFPEALYQESNIPVSPLLGSDGKPSLTPASVVRKRRACLECHFRRLARCNSEKKPKLLNGSKDDDSEDSEVNNNTEASSHQTENILEVSSGNEDVRGLLSRMKRNLSRLNADAVAVIGSYSGNCVVSEPLVIPGNNNVGGNNDPPLEENFGEHISAELKVLKDQLTKTNAILSTLSRGQQFVFSMPAFLQEPHTVKGERKHHHQSDLLPTTDRKRHSWLHERTASVSQKSTPLHRNKSLTRSCPNLPNQWHVATRGTQTEDRASPDLPRNRSASFVAAIRTGHSSTEETADDVPSSRPENDALREPDVCPSGEGSSYGQRKLSILPEEDTDDDPLRPQHYSTRQQKHKHPPPYRPPPVPCTSSRSAENLPMTISFETSKSINSLSKQISTVTRPDRVLRFPMERQKSLPASFCFSVTSATPSPSSESPFVFRGAGSIKLNDRTISERKHHKHAQHVRIARTESDEDNKDVQDEEEEDEGKQAARKRRRSFSSGNYGFAFDHEEEEQQLAAIRAVASCVAKQAGGKVGAEQSKEIKNKFLMPEMESSETESAKDSANGSMESETAEPPPSTDEQQSLASNFLKKGFLSKPADLTSQEIEEKFGTLALAFKTDKFTMAKRLELHKRQRDTAEQNIEEEIKKMKDVLAALNVQCLDLSTRDLLADLQQHVDIIQQSTSRMSCRSEVYGAVQQEERTNQAFEIMVTYVEQLKRLYDREHQDLEDTRRLLLENRLLHDPAGGELFLDDPKRTLRSLTGKPVARRRASVAVFHRPLLQDRGKSPVSSILHTGALVEQRARFHFPTLVNVYKEHALGNISVSSDSTVTGNQSDTQSNEDCSRTSLETMAGTSQPEFNAETHTLVSYEASSGDYDCEATVMRYAELHDEKHVLEDEPVEETCAKDESSPSNSSCTTVQLAKKFILNSADIWHQRISEWIPDEFPWEVSSMVRVLRYGLGTLIFIGALVCLLSAFLPGKTSACSSHSTSSSYMSIQEFLEIVFRPYLSVKQKHTPV